jgi:hypothetical protein
MDTPTETTEGPIHTEFYNPLKADKAAIVTLMKCYCGNPEIYINFIDLLERNNLTSSQALIEYGKNHGKASMIRLGYQIKSYEINKWDMFKNALTASRGEVIGLKAKVAKEGKAGCWVNSSVAAALENV